MRAALELVMVLTCASLGALATWKIAGPPSREIPCDPAALAPEEICLATLQAEWPAGSFLWIDARPAEEWRRDGVGRFGARIEMHAQPLEPLRGDGRRLREELGGRAFETGLDEGGAEARAPGVDADRGQPGGERLQLVAGATATSDRRDVIPAAIEAAGGTVARVGMPVDPGNLLVLGTLREALVLGLPGCARSPSRNGLDLLLERWAAGLPVSADHVAAMGVGGLLEGGGRPVPWGWSG